MADAPDAAEVLQGNTVFANRVYQILSKTPGNVFFSPLSLHGVLAMAYQGAQGETARLLAHTLKIPDSKSTALGYKTILDHLKSLDDVALSMACKIYARQHEAFLHDFETVLDENFGSKAQFLDFEDKSTAVKIINEWVEEQTQARIQAIVDEEFITKETALILINALYFKGDWSEQFLESVTATRSFYLDDGSVVDVQMMNGKKTGFYKSDDELNAQIVALPFGQHSVKMLLVVPKEAGIADLETKLASINLATLTLDLNRTVVDLSLPKFKLEATMDLKTAIADMGLLNIFEKFRANFRGMIELTPDENLCVDKIFQKAVIEVNEWGAEAAAASFVRLRKVRKSGRHEDFVTVNVDHPAIFMLLNGEGPTTNVLFFGRLSHPKY